MRVVRYVLTVLLIIVVGGFVFTNPDVRVERVTVWKTDYQNVSLFLIVFVALVVGILYAAFIGVGEGLQMWVTNRRLTREIQKLETELNYLRTQPLTRASASESPETEAKPGSQSDADEAERGTRLPTAPVYGAEDDDDPDDDVYSGGRAV